jgi:hypothetical protein
LCLEAANVLQLQKMMSRMERKLKMEIGMDNIFKVGIKNTCTLCTFFV